MFRRDSNDHLDKLISRLVDGLISEAEQAELEQILRSDPAARERYRLHVAAHVELATQPRELSKQMVVSFWQKVSLPLAAAASMALIISSVLWLRRPATLAGTPPPQAEVAPSDSPVLAVASLVKDAAWKNGEPLASGAKLRTGIFNLSSGVLVLDLVRGERLTLRGPASFELLSEREMLLHSGDAALRVGAEATAYIIRVPGGAVVDLGTEISVKVGPDGDSDVRVFEGLANASVVDSAGRTRQERRLRAGDAVRISATLENSDAVVDSFVRSFSGSQTDLSPAGDAYAAAVADSRPLSWWRFDHMPDPQTIAPEAGQIPLVLHGNPRIAGPEGGRFLLTDESEAAGFAMPPTTIPNLDTNAGLSVEFLIHPLSENYGTALAIDQPDLPPPPMGRYVRHPPQRLVIERTGPRGAHIGHVHPDFALRAMMRSPAGYEGGINTYSSESHLMGRWIHVAFTHDGKRLRLYVDGLLSDEAVSNLAFLNRPLRPIIGRMQPTRSSETRQWHGGIDEVALYGRVLTSEEIASHSDALAR